MKLNRRRFLTGLGATAAGVAAAASGSRRPESADAVGETLSILGQDNNSVTATLKAGDVILRPGADVPAETISFYGARPVTRPEATGSCGGNSAMAKLLAEMDSVGILTDSTRKA